MRKMSTNPTEYVVFDIETNGLKSKTDDVLSISFYKPDDGREYNKFLPLELNSKVLTTHINGITEKKLIGATALTQIEFDHIVNEFELEKRTIIFFAGRDFDATFLSAYMKRHRIAGYEKLKFYNFKKNIISSKFSHGNISKDNLCLLFGIEDVKKVHASLNDCKLEWQLFKKMDGYFYLVTEGKYGDDVFRLSEDYIVPASLFYSHSNLSRVLSERPYIECQSHLVKSFEIDASEIEKFPANFTGMTVENLINSMLNVEEQDSYSFLLNNKRKLDFIGTIPDEVTRVPMFFNPDGTVTAVHKKDCETERRLNSTIANFRKCIQPLIEFIRNDIFDGDKIMSQELVVDSENNVLALCDLSTKKTVLEIKTNSHDSTTYKEQFFYEARGREVYHLKMEWIRDGIIGPLNKIIFHVLSVDVHIGNPPGRKWNEGRREAQRASMIAEIQNYLSSSQIALLSYKNSGSPVRIKCKNCEYEWAMGYATFRKKIPDCPKCNPKVNVKITKTISDEEKLKLRADNYREKILEKSNYTIVVSNYVGSKEDVDATCVI